METGVSPTDQTGDAVRLEWGKAAIKNFGPTGDVIVVVDTLSFSTAVDVAVSAGAKVWPFRWWDARAQAFVREQSAVLAGRREAGGMSLSPTSLLSVTPSTRLVLPSPNGGTLSFVNAAALLDSRSSVPPKRPRLRPICSV
ncbi:hypothetical protein ACFFLM_09935 [Deinococcus oregonensis]|uniref:2-phosphosulfolactate phosphatase n=1 Tax=Deinococcus oregonensis TaxID=1805970 RepID=A0ABV6AXQ0_9DEIO